MDEVTDFIYCKISNYIAIETNVKHSYSYIFTAYVPF